MTPTLPSSHGLWVRAVWRALCIALWLSGGVVHAHGTRVGDLRINHAYALPSRPHTDTAQVYIRSLQNNGNTPDALLSASTAMATTVALFAHHDAIQASDRIEVLAGAQISLKHDASQGPYLQLQGLKRPLQDGDRFDLQLRFQRAGFATVTVWVQTPR